MFKELSTDFAGYMTEDLTLAHVLRAYRAARQGDGGGGGWGHAMGGEEGSQEYVIDVGANRCELSVEIGKVLGGGVTIVALEPVERLARSCSLVIFRVAEREKWDVSTLSRGRGGARGLTAASDSNGLAAHRLEDRLTWSGLCVCLSVGVCVCAYVCACALSPFAFGLLLLCHYSTRSLLRSPSGSLRPPSAIFSSAHLAPSVSFSSAATLHEALSY